jgi:protein-tyrosine phosphatase
MDPLVKQLRELLTEQTEPYQMKMKAKHSRLKKRVIGHGGQRAGAPYSVKPSMKRSKSAPPIGENVVYTSLEEGFVDTIKSLFGGKQKKESPSFSAFDVTTPHNTMPDQPFNHLYDNVYIGQQPVDIHGNLKEYAKEFDKVYIVASEVDYNQKPEEKDKVVIKSVGRDTQHPDQQTLDNMENVAQEISKQSGKILVTCKAGLNRSASIAARAIMLKDPSKKNQIVNLVRQSRGPRSLSLDIQTHGIEGEHEKFINFILNGPPKSETAITERIVKKGSKWCLHSKKNNKNLGCYSSKKDVKKREKQVQYFKHMKESAVEQMVREVIREILK